MHKNGIRVKIRGRVIILVALTHRFSNKNLSLPSVFRHTPLRVMVCARMLTSPNPPWYHRPCQSSGKEHFELPGKRKRNALISIFYVKNVIREVVNPTQSSSFQKNNLMRFSLTFLL